ncbi:MAG: hemolysin family protein [Spirochaetia bacterium]
MIYLQIGILVILLTFSAFFSGTETAFFSLNGLERESLRKNSKGKKQGFIQLLFTNPDQVLITILTGNMLVNVFATTFSDVVGAELVGKGSELFTILIMTPLLLIFGEMTPKNIAIRHSMSFAAFSSSPAGVIHRLLLPITFVLGKIRHVFLSKQHQNGDELGIKNSAVLSAIRMGYQSGKIQESELNLLESFFDFRLKTAKDVMIPRIETFGVDINSPLEELFVRPNIMKKSQRPYVIVYKGDIDNIIGYINRKELLTRKLSGQTERSGYHDHLKQVHMTPEKKPVMDLLAEMREIESEIAVVIDEYGGTAGIINYQIIVEYLFEDFFPASERSIIPIEKDTYLAPGSLETNSLNEYFGSALESESRTLGGFIIDQLGTFPENGYILTHQDYEFTVISIEKNRIKKVRIRRLEG